MQPQSPAARPDGQIRWTFATPSVLDCAPRGNLTRWCDTPPGHPCSDGDSHPRWRCRRAYVVFASL